MEYSYNTIKDNLTAIRSRIAEECDKYGRAPESVEIMAVTKTVPAEVVNYVFGMGIDLIGENRVQEYLSKQQDYASLTSLGTSPRVHFIGHLQTNKVKYITESVSMIQSVDSVRLASEISRQCMAKGRVMDVLCEVNIGGETSKSGIASDELGDLLKAVSELEGIRLRGLMTIPPPSESDIYLGRMGGIYEKYAAEYGMDVLSMGMSGDYARAVRYGSTLVRVGTGLFGARNYNV